MIKILIYEDSSQLREGLTMLLNGTEGFEVVGAYRNCNQVEEEVEAWQPDVRFDSLPSVFLYFNRKRYLPGGMLL